MASEKLEENFNAHQMMLNLLLHSLAGYSPEVIDSWCDLVDDVLRNEPKIPPTTRAIMERTAQAMRTAIAGEEGDARH